MADIRITPVGGQNFFDQFDGPKLDNRSRDLAIRTIYGEAAAEPDEGLAAVAAVIRNRLDAGRFGKDIPAVVLAPNQFEPWSRPDARARMMALKPGMPQYDKIGTIVDQVFGGQMPDPTNGATHFYAPQAQAALGRQPPKWAANQEPLNIGRHAFFAPEGRVRAAQAQPQQPTAPAGNFFDQFDNAPGAAPVAERFAETPAPANSDALRSALHDRAAQMTRGPAQPPAVQMAQQFANVGPAASQRTNPNPSAYRGQLVSAEVFEDDGGTISYRDPQTGEVKPTDQATQVAIRDPADGRVKIFARSEATNESPVTGAARILSQGLATGGVTARPSIPAVPKNIRPTASDTFATAKPFYRAFKNEAGQIEIPPETATGIADRLRTALDRANLIEDLAKPVYSAVAILDRGEPLTLDVLQNIKRVAGRGFNSPDKNIRDAAAVVSGEIGKIIGEVSKTAAQNLKTGDAIHSTARSMQELQRASSVADLRAGRAGYGGNTVNSMRQVLSPIVQRAVNGKSTGFQPGELKVLREIVEGTPVTNALRGVGQLSPSKGIIQTVGAGGAIYAAGPAAVAIPAIGAVSNKLAAYLTWKQIERLMDLTAKRSPAYTQAVTRAIERWERAQLELVNSPSPAKLAGAISASRALSAGLTRDGIAVSSGDLLRAIQAPVKSAAEEEQPTVPRRPGE